MNLSPRVPVCRTGRQHGGQGSCQHLARKAVWSQVGSRAEEVPSPAGQSLWWPMPRENSSTLACGARLSQQWSGTCLSHTLKVVHSTLLGLSDKCLGTPDAKWGIFQGAHGWYMAVLLDTPAGKCGISPGPYLWLVLLCRHGYSNYMCRYLRCVSLPDVPALT